jgi:hypothetical protein
VPSLAVFGVGKNFAIDGAVIVFIDRLYIIASPMPTTHLINATCFSSSAPCAEVPNRISAPGRPPIDHARRFLPSKGITADVVTLTRVSPQAICHHVVAIDRQSFPRSSFPQFVVTGVSFVDSGIQCMEDHGTVRISGRTLRYLRILPTTKLPRDDHSISFVSWSNSTTLANDETYVNRYLAVHCRVRIDIAVRQQVRRRDGTWSSLLIPIAFLRSWRRSSWQPLTPN